MKSEPTVSVVCEAMKMRWMGLCGEMVVLWVGEAHSDVCVERSSLLLELSLNEA